MLQCELFQAVSLDGRTISFGTNDNVVKIAQKCEIEKRHILETVSECEKGRKGSLKCHIIYKE